MSEIINGMELRVIGMSRSGNHAIINWIIRQASGRICFLNCAEPKNNPFETARPLEDERRIIANFDLEEQGERNGRFSRKDWLILSHEDCFLGMVTKGDYGERHDEFVGPSRMRRDLLVLRDPFNLFARRLKSGYSGVTPATTSRTWKQHAREFLGDRRYLPPRPLDGFLQRLGQRSVLPAEAGGRPVTGILRPGLR